MLASITPLGERSRHQRWRLTVTAHVVGSALGGAAAGAVVASLGRLLPLADGGRLLVFACLLIAGGAVDLGLKGARVPTHRRQVDERWLRAYRGWVYGGGFGLQLGSGVATIVSTAAVYVTLAGALLAPSVAAGCLVGASFGLTRGLVPMSTARVTSPQALRSFHGRLAARARSATLAAAGAQLALGVLAFGLVLR